MPVQTPQWSEFLSCPVCQNEFETKGRLPVSLTCGHTVCRTCLESLQREQCPFDQNPIGLELTNLPVNTALLLLIGNGEVPREYRSAPGVPLKDKDQYSRCIQFLEDLAVFLKPSQSSQLSRPMQRKLITLVTCQLLNDEGRARGVRAARSLGERSVTELILQHQNPQQLSANLWAAVRARGCQFLGPAMQEEVLKLVLLALEEGSALSRKVLVMFVVQRLEPHFPQASKTSIGHVVQLLYRASCFKVTKRDGDSSLMQLKDEFRTYENLRREHDTQIVQIATEGGLRIAPDQWSSLLYGDSSHKSHMQSIIDKLQTPQSFGQSVQELVIALQRTGDPGRLSCLRPYLDVLTNIDPSSESEVPTWSNVIDSLKAAHAVVNGLLSFCNLTGAKKTGETYNGHLTRFKTSMCRDLAQHGSCPRGNNCTFAHTQTELEFHRNGSRGRPNTKDMKSQYGYEDGKRDTSTTPVKEVTSPTPADQEIESAGGEPIPTAKQPPKQVSPLVAPQYPQMPPKQAALGPVNLVGQVAIQQTVQVPVHHAGQGMFQAGQLQFQPINQFQETCQQVPLQGGGQVGGHILVPQAGQQGGPAGQFQVGPVPMQAAGAITVGPIHQQGATGHIQQTHSGQILMLPTMQGGTQITPVVDANGTPMIDMTTGQPLVAAHAPLMSPVQLADGTLYPVQQQVQIANLQVGQSPLVVQHGNSLIPCTAQDPIRRLGHDLSPDIATKSLSALKGRKEEIISELGDIVGPTAARAIGDITLQQATGQKFGLSVDMPRRQSSGEITAVTEVSLPGFYGIWTSKPLVTMSSLIQATRTTNIATQSQGGEVPTTTTEDDEIKPLPEGICVSRFGPISRRMNTANNSAGFNQSEEPRSVMAKHMGVGTMSTSSMLQPLSSAAPVPDNILLVPDRTMLFEYNPGYYSDYYAEFQGMDSVNMQHLVNPPILPISPMPNPRDQGMKLNSQNISMYVETNRIQKELQDLQRRISCLSVAENSAQMALKRDRLAFELRMVEGGIQERHQEIEEVASNPEEKAATVNQW